MMTPAPQRRLAADGTYNIRDLGGYKTPDGETRWQRMLRSDGLHRIKPDGMAILLQAGLRKVIDLRNDQELETSPNPFAKQEGVTYLHVSLFDGLSPRSAAVNAGGDVLLDLYIQALSTRGAAIRAVLEAIANTGGGTVLFHCTAGKDRTGIIAGLLLSIAEVSRELILADYALTGDLIAPLIDELVCDAEKHGADVETFRKLLGSDPNVMSAMLDYIADTYGSVQSYLKTIGLDDETLARLRSRLLDADHSNKNEKDK
ncbi:tyrosine-protein phosphatase [Pararhizobium sp. YC-54]|uniref:tyrosine-protein phosphatase n=1 Tax=Pararhizobium sp. YC-54 TaxID=2986920 RepID=UPI0021F78091|nr:tyrosine-protein phosphatase [Pararhizobium sp. YC-54]MCV9999653.1 tyrosine-protein phosphatase [Pararhizobium sp. YC-54]